MTTPRRVLLAVLIAIVPLLAQPLAALAHPLGNFTINHYSRIEVTRESVRVRYVVDMAEIPTFQAMSSLDANGDGKVSDAEAGAYATQMMAQIARNLHLSLGGREMLLRTTEKNVELLPGQAGLQTLRLTAWLEAPAAAQAIAHAGDQALRLEYRDDDDAERIGWREIVVQADGVALAAAAGTLPTQDVSDELRHYPDDMLTSPLDVRHVQATVSLAWTPAAAGSPAVSTQRAAHSPSLARATDGLTELLTRATSVPLTAGVVALALVTAIALGAMHALSPGHGKTIVGAYLVGSRGTAQHALFLGVTVTAVHTAGVFALGLATLSLSQYVVPERVYPWLTLVSGLLVLGMGLALVRSRWLNGVQGSKFNVQRSGAGHTHSELSTQHLALVHDHGFGTHSHAVPGADAGAVTWRSLLALGVSGGLLPCPSALVVMLGAIALHRIAFGLVLIVAFSTGLAGTLMAIGLAMVFSGRAAGRLRLSERFGASRAAQIRTAARILPIASAGVVALAGCALAFDGAQQLHLASWLATPAVRLVAPLGLAAVLGGGTALLALGGRRTPAVATVPAGTTDGHVALAPHTHGPYHEAHAH